MKVTKVVNKDNLQTGPAGLILLGEMFRAIELDKIAKAITSGNPQISVADIFRTMIGLLSQGKSDFEHVKAVINDEFFMNSMGIERVPSAETYRQRFQELSSNEELEVILPELSIRLWKKYSLETEYIEKDQNKWVRVDIDPVIYDNADTKKEGAAYTYNNQFGFSPVFAHFSGGWMINAKLYHGNFSTHSQEAIDFVLQSLNFADKMVEAVKLLVMDCGFDNQQMLQNLWNRPNTDFLVKHNIRRESLESWLEEAKEKGELVCTDQKKGYHLYRGSTYRHIEGCDEPVRLVFEVREIFKKKGQLLLMPQVKVFSVWTSLDQTFTDKEVLKLYRMRGTSEQFHSEFKTDMDMERLPSGKFQVNSVFLLMGMLTHNMLKVIAEDMVTQKDLGLKKATRRRIKTVMTSVVFMSSRIVKHARQLILQLGCSRPWFDWFASLFTRLKQA